MQAQRLRGRPTAARGQEDAAPRRRTSNHCGDPQIDIQPCLSDPPTPTPILLKAESKAFPVWESQKTTVEVELLTRGKRAQRPSSPSPLLTPLPLTSNNTAQTNQNRLPTSLRGLSVKACILGLLYWFQIHTQTGEGVKMCPEPLDYSERRGSEDYGGVRRRRQATVKMFDATELKTILCQAECLPRGFSSDDKHLGMCRVLLHPPLHPVLPPPPIFLHMVNIQVAPNAPT